MGRGEGGAGGELILSLTGVTTEPVDERRYDRTLHKIGLRFKAELLEELLRGILVDIVITSGLLQHTVKVLNAHLVVRVVRSRRVLLCAVSKRAEGGDWHVDCKVRL